MIFFDIDDTLLDYKTSQDLAANRFSEVYSGRLVVESHQFIEFWDTITKKHMNRYLSGEITFLEQRRERIRESISNIRNDVEADDIFNEYHAVYKSSWQLFPDCIEALESLKNRRLGIITNGDPEQQLIKLEKLSIAHYFEFVITPSDVGAAKPSPKIFEYAASLSGVPGNQCWYVGDDYEKDFQASKKLNWNSIMINRNPFARLSDGMFSSLLEFANTQSRY